MYKKIFSILLLISTTFIINAQEISDNAIGIRFGGEMVSASRTGIYAAGVMGFEFNFNIPLLLFLDFRPEIGVADGLNGVNSDIALSVKHQF